MFGLLALTVTATLHAGAPLHSQAFAPARSAGIQADAEPREAEVVPLVTPVPLAVITPQAADEAPWELIGPGYKIGTGITTQVSFHPQSPTEMLLATRPYGMYLSEDGGKTWKQTGTPFDAGLNSGPNWGLVRAPSNPAIVYVSLENPGAWRSDDGGRTWSDRSGTLPGGRAKRGVVVAVHPTNPDVVWMGTDGGLFKSTNGGRIWRPLTKGVPTGKVKEDNDRHQTVCSVILDPRNPDLVRIGIYATGHDEPAGVWRSDDGGETWKSTSVGIDNAFPENQNEDPKMKQLAKARRPDWIHWMVQAASQPDTLYIRAGSGTYVSRDGGGMWKKLPEIPASYGLEVDPTNPQRLVAARLDGGALLSDDGGQSWHDLSLGLPRGKVDGVKDQKITLKLPDGTSMELNAHLRSEVHVVESFAFAPGNPSIINASTSSGLYRLTLPAPPRSP